MTTSPINDIKQQLQDVTELISLPEIYFRFHRVMEDQTADIHDFAEVIRLDPNLSLSTLKMVNSAYFGFPEKIDSIAQAANMIGIAQLDNMVLGLSAMSSLDLPNDFLALKTFWRRSLFSGVLSRQLARQLKMRHGERLFIMGLLHEIGHLVLYARFPQQARACEHFAKLHGLPIHLAEQQLIGFHYGDIGAMLMEHWGLSSEFQTATRLQPAGYEENVESIEVGLLHLAHAYAHQEITENNQSADMLINPRVWEITGLSADAVVDSLAAARCVCTNMEKVLKI